MKNKDHIFESAYWAGRMIDMPDSKMAWDIANEIASELKQERNKAIDEALERKFGMEGPHGLIWVVRVDELESLKH